MILIDPVLDAWLRAQKLENQPVIGANGLGGTATVSTSIGTEVVTADNINTPTTYDFWEATPNGAGRVDLQYVFAANVTLDFVGLGAHNLGSIGADVRVQYSVDAGVTWQSAASPTASPADDAAIGFRFTAISADYWRIHVTNAGTSNVIIGTAILTNEIRVSSPIFQGYAPPFTPTRVDLQTNVSEGAQLLGSSVVRQGSGATARLANLDPSVLRADPWLSFQKSYNAGEGFFWAWRPGDYGDLFYAWREGAVMVPENGPGGLMALQMNMRFYDEP